MGQLIFFKKNTFLNVTKNFLRNSKTLICSIRIFSQSFYFTRKCELNRSFFGSNLIKSNLISQTYPFDSHT